MSDAVPYCVECNEPVALDSRFCPHCGHRVMPNVPGEPPPAADSRSRSEASVDEFESRETQRLASDFFERHIAAIHETRSKTDEILREIQAHDRSLDALERAPFTPERGKSVQTVLEDLEAVGERWEDLQHAYNRESEALDEEFLDQAAELEVDLDLPVALQGRLEEEVTAMTTALETLQSRIETLGARGNGLISGPEGRHFAAVQERREPWLLQTLGPLATVLSAVILWRFGLAWPRIVWALAPFLLPWLISVSRPR